MITADKSLKSFARSLVQLSLEDGQVSADRVHAVLNSLKAKPRRGLETLLKLYLYYLKREIRHSQAIVEYSGTLAPDTLARIEKNLSVSYGRKITAVARENPSLVAGLRISVADDVLDASVAGRLENLSRSVR